MTAPLTKPQAYEDQGEVLKPYVPRLLIEWVRESPDTNYRAHDGTLAFVDISGFTALTERLARRGKIGAEELRDVLDRVFIDLLDEAYDWGAGLLKWGGDALLLLFDGPGHAERGARAAWEMQRIIERVGRIRLAGGTTILRMSIGMTTGTIDFFTAGSVHRELLVVGPTATETVVMEAIADAGEIALSPTLAAALDPACIGAQKGQAFLLHGPPAASPEPAPDVGDVSGALVAGCIPLAARAHVLLERSEPEHRMITAAFIDLMHTDELLARHGSLRFGQAVDERIGVIEEAARTFEVPFNASDISNGSIKVLLSAGAPSSNGHDEEQTLRLAREVMDQPGLIPMRIGIDTGRVFTGDFGPPYRRTYAALGDAINTAARVMSGAGPGEILATEAVLARSRTTFALTPVAPLEAKGKAEPVDASLVGRITGRRRERMSEPPFAGRKNELATLATVLGDVAAGRSWTVEVSGAAGIGKSRLVREALAAAPGVRVLHATCEEYDASTPYSAVRDLVRELLRLERGATPAETERVLRRVVSETAPELAPWLPLLAILLGLDLPATPETSAVDERFLRDVLAEVTLRFLVATLAYVPVALVLEDAHFMDEASADLLNRLARAAASVPLALVVTRSEPGPSWLSVDAEELRQTAFVLLPISEREAVEVVERTTDQEPLRPHEVEEIARRSGGSPLFLVELLEGARSTGSTEALPDSVEAAVMAEIDQLSPSDRTVLRYAAVLGVAFDSDLLSAALHDEVTVDDELWERLRGLVDRDPAGRLRFRNTLVRDGAYEGLPFRRRRELHARVAEAIELTALSVEEESATLALHFSAANRHDKAWHYGRLGGDRARLVAANVEAARLYGLALSSAGRVRTVSRRDRAEMLVKLGIVREMAGLYDESLAALRRATGLLRDDPVEQARIFALRTRARVRMGSYTLALRDTASGLRLVVGRSDTAAIAARATLRAMRSEIRMIQGHAREAITLALAAVGEAQDGEDLEALARAYAALDGSYQMLGEPEKAVHERMALEIYTTLGHDRSRGITELNLGVQAYADGRWDEAVDLYVRAQEDCLRAGDRPNAAIAKANLGELLVSRGELDEAERLLADARRVLRSSGYLPFALFAETQLARIALVRGQVDSALQALTTIVEQAERNAYAASALESALYFAQAATAAGRPSQGLGVLDEAARQAGDEAVLYSVPIGRVRGAALVSLGRRADAATCLDETLAGARQQSLLHEQLLTLREQFSLARALGSEPSPEDLREAARLAQILGVSSELGRGPQPVDVRVDVGDEPGFALRVNEGGR